MKTLLQRVDGSKEELLVPDDAIANVAIIQRGEMFYIFDGYLGNYAHTAVFTECPAPLILQEQNQKPAPRRFLGHNPKGE
jgi:hypothetical protein